MQEQTWRVFDEDEHHTWRLLFQGLDQCRQDMAHPVFAAGIEKLGISAQQIPDLNSVNRRRRQLTGWQGVPVVGLEDNASFFRGLAARRFPIGNFIRDIRDVSYTPAPDVFHDLYGHLPFLADEDFANFCAEFGARAARWADSSLAMILWGRLFWFGVEFPLIGTAAGRKIFGGGILSSRGESEWSLSTGPQVVAFDPRVIIDLDYKIDEYQKKLFCLSSAQELYSCLVEYEELIKNKVQAASLFQETAGPRTETFFSAGRI